MAKAGKSDLEKKAEAEEEEEKRRKALEKEKEEQKALLNRWKVSYPDSHSCWAHTTHAAGNVLTSEAQCRLAVGLIVWLTVECKMSILLNNK